MKFIAAIAILLTLTACKPAPPQAAPPTPSTPQILAVPESGAYTGAYMDFGEKEDTVTLEAIEAFEKLVGKHQAIVASSSYWGEQTFPMENVKIITRHGAVPLIFWSPWDHPYKEDAGPDNFSLTRILAGDWDAYIDNWGKSAAEFGQPMIVSFANEPNGTWFPWSGTFYGAGNPGSAPGTFAGPETFVKTWRHIVDRVRAQGAKNVLWVFHVMNYGYPNEPWNSSINYYPGDDYVDWIGLSIYGRQFIDENWSDFTPLFDWPYRELTQAIPNKPFLAVEWGVAEFLPIGQKAQFISDGLSQMLKFPRLKGAVFWHERWENSDGSYSNLRVNSSREALKAYQSGVADKRWLDRPVFK